MAAYSAAVQFRLNKSLDDVISSTGSSSSRKFRKGFSGIDREKPYSRRVFENDHDDRGTSHNGIVTNRVYVGNLAYSTSWQDLKDLFRQCGNVVYADVFTDGPNGLSKGCGIVEFETKQEAINAIKTFHNYHFNGRDIFVREDREDRGPNQDDNRFQRSSFGTGSGNREGRFNSNSNNQVSDTQVFVQNFPYETSWQDLKDIFREIGPVAHVDVLETQDGRSRGQAVVEFERPGDARRAIRLMNDFQINGRNVEVREYRL